MYGTMGTCLFPAVNNWKKQDACNNKILGAKN